MMRSALPGFSLRLGVACAGLALVLLGCGGSESDEAEEDESAAIRAISPAWADLLTEFEPAILKREASDVLADNLPDGVQVEAIELRGPADYVIRTLLARPVEGSDLPCAIVSGRAVHENVATLEQMIPLLALGHAVLICEVWRGALPGESENWHANEQQIWRRERGVRALRACFRFLEGEAWSSPLRRYLIGASRGSNLVLPTAVRELSTRLLVLVTPVMWNPPGLLEKQVPDARRELVGPTFKGLNMRLVAAAMNDTTAAVVLASEDRNLSQSQGISGYLGEACKRVRINGVGHVFDFELALDQELGDWLNEELAKPWSPPKTSREVPGSVIEAMRKSGLGGFRGQDPNQPKTNPIPQDSGTDGADGD